MASGMLRPLVTRLRRPHPAFNPVAAALDPGAARPRPSSPPSSCLSFSATARREAAGESESPSSSEHASAAGKFGTGVPRDEMPFFHHVQTERPKPKFKSPRKRASKLFHELNAEAVQKSIERNPAVLQVPFRVGDAVEIEQVVQGGVNSTDREKIRGVVLGRENRGLDTSIYLRDVVFGQPIERKVVLHSPLVKSLRVIEKNFVFKGKRKVKRAKLYYLRDRKPEETRVTKW